MQCGTVVMSLNLLEELLAKKNKLLEEVRSSIPNKYRKSYIFSINYKRMTFLQFCDMQG